MAKRFKYYQPNKKDIKDERGDCVIRALTKATGKTWLEVFDELIPYARELQSLPNDKVAYERFLDDNGFKWYGVKVAKGKKRPTPETFCKQFPTGTYVLRLAHHLVTVIDGYYYDIWDCGDSGVYGYWVKEV